MSIAATICSQLVAAMEDVSRLLGDELSGVSQMTYEDSITNLPAHLDEYLVR
jgi:hypothetical protein